ncbi:putative B-cell differentiation antigen CD72 [Apostichopus japonicus]|uniref:Putative B-cell differentiation antigen CD72 n=1 Tax=Stichopus japonicus TaxID=307972 RepID=A0A2G8LBK0_STIJA|nr:putative B-cell differentiation antigen CD72 [Apostichopus japonicus]
MKEVRPWIMDVCSLKNIGSVHILFVFLYLFCVVRGEQVCYSTVTKTNMLVRMERIDCGRFNQEKDILFPSEESVNISALMKTTKGRYSTQKSTLSAQTSIGSFCTSESTTRDPKSQSKDIQTSTTPETTKGRYSTQKNTLLANQTDIGSVSTSESTTRDSTSQAMDIQTSTSPGCPDGWTMFQSSCYSVSSGYETWDHAKSKCASFHSDAHLAFIETPQENTFVYSFISMNNYYPWIGINDIAVEDAWRRYDDIPAAPPTGVSLNQNEDTSDCVYINSATEWRAYPCTSISEVLCELEM